MTAPTLRGLLEGERFAVLATLSARRGGWPFASVTAFALLQKCGEPLLLLSDLAEHTRNLGAVPRASLLVQDSTAAGKDPQAHARVTLLGTIVRVSEAELERAQQTYVSTHPEASEYFKLGDFRLYKMQVSEARFVNGFGDMGWLAAEQVRAALAE